MSRRPDCYANAAVERFFYAIETEVVHRQHATHNETGLRYIDGLYNYHRRHSEIGYINPVET
ncbi:hypothetical protein [Bradyrhizobium sp. USDA 223]|uniref:hypothetical protein n=1 Tax=Bradyrhizobium sp. USDA 223 TaxID=3156306 RepID=UPI003838E838